MLAPTGTVTALGAEATSGALDVMLKSSPPVGAANGSVIVISRVAPFSSDRGVGANVADGFDTATCTGSERMKAPAVSGSGVFSRIDRLPGVVWLGRVAVICVADCTTVATVTSSTCATEPLTKFIPVRASAMSPRPVYTDAGTTVAICGCALMIPMAAVLTTSPASVKSVKSISPAAAATSAAINSCSCVSVAPETSVAVTAAFERRGLLAPDNRWPVTVAVIDWPLWTTRGDTVLMVGDAPMDTMPLVTT